MPLEKAIAQAIFKSLVGERLSAAGMIRIARRSGGTYRRKEMLADIRTYTDRRIHENAIRRMDPWGEIPKSWLSEETLKMDRRYRIFGKGLYENKLTGAQQWKNVSLYADELLNPIDYANYYIENQPLTETDPKRTVKDFTLTGVSHNATWTY